MRERLRRRARYWDNLQLPRERERRKNETTLQRIVFHFLIFSFGLQRPRTNSPYFRRRFRDRARRSARSAGRCDFRHSFRFCRASRARSSRHPALRDGPTGNTRHECARPIQLRAFARGKIPSAGHGFGIRPIAGDVELASSEKHIRDLHLTLSALRDKVVVSAALGGALTSQIGSSVSVVSADEIDARGAQVATDVLRGLPGVEINQSGGRGTISSAFIRGGDSDYNLVMIDGIELNDFGGGFDLSPLPAGGVEQVEVISGPESALYGSNAVAGVINLETIHGDGPPHFTFLGEGGSLYTWRLATTGAGLNQGFSWAYSLSRLQTDGQKPNDAYRGQTATVSLGYSRSPRRKFDVNFFGYAGLLGLPGPWGSNPDGLFPGLDPSTHQNQNLF